ncbi:nmra-like family domain-containing protein 1 [Plakobranchus ocellatus]|uniref:NmrA-like family domain-containing protein 1 n=1 Tax=Plakobranchus ocellatus TaxID=259542 RepID=A0AAV3Z594_9GAST|nr:nmra-like family domain-containing protein 1 [Plakobranchus ocellatus]
MANPSVTTKVSPTMKVPSVGGKISTTKPEQTSASTLKSTTAANAAQSGGGDKGERGGALHPYKAIGNLGKRQSESLMDVTVIKNRSGGGRGGKAGEGMDSVVEIAVPPPMENGVGGASPECTDRQHNASARGGAAHDGRDGELEAENPEAQEDRQVIGQRYEDYVRRYSTAIESMHGDKPRGFGEKIKHMIRKMGCGTSQMTNIEETLPVVVIGATGTVGGAVARALLRDHRFTVRAVTRTPSTDQARALAEEGAVVVAADLNDTRSLCRVMEGAAGVFLTTNFWEHLSKQREIAHGMNAVDAAVMSNVHHFIMHGSDPTSADDPKCGYMDAKAAIEVYLRESTLPFTVVKLPFLYENLISFFKPHLISPGLYTLPLPMENVPLDIMALQDIARCVVNIFLRPKNHMFRSVALAGERMTIQCIADHLNKLFDDRTITYVKITPEDFATFDFPGSQDIAAMFVFLQKAPARDTRVTRKIFHSVTIFDKWAQENKDRLIAAMRGDDTTSC